ncbi:MAG: TonB-dependent receptor [Caulobacteraceae bacterium]
MRRTAWFGGMALAAWAGASGALAAPAPGRDVSEVIVTAAPYAVSLDSVTSSVSVLDRRALDVAPPAGLGDVLAGTPGVRSSFYGPGASRPVIRGLSGPRVLILQNGVGLVDASALSPDHAVASEPSEATRIEVLRGPSALAYGGSGIGGVVNIIDDRVPSSPAASGLEGRLSGSASSGDDGYALAAGLKAGSGPWVAAFDVSRRESGDYAVPTPEGRVFNSDVGLTAYGAGLSYVSDDGFIGASVKRTVSRYGVPYAPPNPPDPAAEGPVQIDLGQTRLDVRGERSVAWGPFERIRLSIGYADYHHAEVDAVTGDTGTRFLSSGTEGRLELIQSETGGRQGAVGVQALSRDFAAIGDEAFVPPVTISELGAFTLQRWDLGAWGLEGGLRLDTRRLDADLAGRPASPAATAFGIDWTAAAARRDFTNVSASAGVFWRPASAWFLALSLSHNRRAPTEFELFADGPHPGTGGYELGDPRLTSEAVTSGEATVRYAGGALRLELHVFAASYDGFIDETATGLFMDETGALAADGLRVFRFTQTSARFSGAEGTAEWEVWRSGDSALSLEGGFDVVRGETAAGPPARIPPWSVTLAAAWRTGRYDGRLEVVRTGDQTRLAPLESPTDGYTLLNLTAAIRPFAGRDVRLFLDGRNLTNALAREHVSFLKDIAPLPGRNIRAGLALSF